MPVLDADRTARHRELLALLATGSFRSQRELCQELSRRGFQVTQASVSRDLRTLGAVKAEGAYALPDPRTAPSGGLRPPDAQPLAQLALGEAEAGPNLLVVRTPIGAAARLGVLLDELSWPEVVGTLSGDDTVFIATRTRRDQVRLCERLAVARGATRIPARVAGKRG